MSIRCERYGSRRLGLFPVRVPVPEIPLEVRTKYGWARQWFLVDTEADITMLPFHASEWLDCELTTRKARVYGIDGEGGRSVLRISPSASENGRRRSDASFRTGMTSRSYSGGLISSNDMTSCS